MEITKRIGPRQSGKTTECIHSMIQHATTTPLENVFVILPTREMTRYFIDKLMDILKDSVDARISYNKSKSRITINGCQFNIISADLISDRTLRGSRDMGNTVVFVDDCLHFRDNNLEKTLDALQYICNIKHIYAYGTQENL